MSAPRLLAPTTISGGIPTAGAGTLNTVALWTPDGFTLGNSLLTQAGSVITNATGAIRANGTTQTTPAFMRYDATTSGIYFPAANEIGFTISSQHAMFISSGRLVGIGTTSPAGRLDVVGVAGLSWAIRAQVSSSNTAPNLNAELGYNLKNTSATVGNYTSITNRDSSDNANTQINFINVNNSGSGAINFVTRGSVGGSAERVRITETGNVGIGTASPNASYKLHVNGGIVAWDGGSNGRVGLIQSGSALTGYVDWRNGAGTRLAFMGGGSAANLNLTLENSANFVIDGGNVGIGTASPAARVNVDGNAVYNNTATQAFRVSNGSTRVVDIGYDSGLEKAFIQPVQLGTAYRDLLLAPNGGNVGIGTASPSTRLHVSDNSSIPVIVQSSGSTDSYLRFINTANNLGYIGYVGTNLYLAPNNGAGNVGIGTASPGYRLHVEDTNLTPGYFKRNATSSTGPAIILDGAGGFSNNYAGLQLRSNNVAIAQIIQETSGSVYFDYNMNSASGALIIRSGGGTERARIDSAGRLGVGLSPSTYILETATDASIYGVRVGRGAGAVSSNTAVGASALNANTSGTGNTAIGASSLSAVTTGTNNTMLGYVAGSGVSTGSSNTMIGFATASGGVTTGSDNTLVGAIAGNQITSGANNVCVGSNAGQTQTTASDNTYVGKNAGYFQLGSTNTAVGRSAMTGASGGASTNTASTAVGYLALQNVTSGNANTAIGSEAGNALTSNGENTFVGQQAGYFPTNGENTAIGRVAMRGISGSSTGSANTALGRAALYSFTTGIQNTALGRNAAFALSSGNNNVLIGERAAETLTTGSANIVIGRLATTAAATDSNQLVLGSATDFVATNGGATTYYATAGASLGYIQVRLNGANVKIQVFAP